MTFLEKYGINNETAEVVRPLPFLTNQLPLKEVSIMAIHTVQNNGFKSQQGQGKIHVKTGERYGRLIILRELDKKDRKEGRRTFLCKCDCGGSNEVTLKNLRNGSVQSCGCLGIEQPNHAHRTHGKSNHPLYNVWSGFMNRCLNNRDYDYHSYGGRGIKICDEWAKDFKVFYDWALENGWEKGLYIDREDVDKGYSPENIRFVGSEINSRNQRIMQSNNTSGYTGVYLDKSAGRKKRWISLLHSNGKTHYLGRYDTPVKAALIRDAKAKELDVGHPLNFN